MVSKLVEDTIIGLSWSVLDYDEDGSKYTGFYNLSHVTRMDSNASCQVPFRLMPLEKQFRQPIEAQWSFNIIDLNERIVAFRDESYGDITSWQWDFDDGTTSTEKNPIHQYTKTGDFVVVLTVKGPSGEARRIKVRDVAVR